MKPKVVSLFAGMAGFDLAFEQEGFEVIAQVEIDKNCQKLLKSKYPDVSLAEDIRAVCAAESRRRHGAPVGSCWIDLLERFSTAHVFTGGFPCTDLSVAGQRAGLAGERSGLWYAFRRVIGLFQPPWVIIENVPGLLSSNCGKDLAAILYGLAELGYRWAYRSLDAQYFSLAQRRERVFIVAGLGASYRSVAEVLFEPESVCGNPSPSRQTSQRIAPTLEGRAGTSSLNNFATSGGLVEVANLCASHHFRQDLDNDTLIAHCLKVGRGGDNDGSDQTYIAYRTAGNCGPFEQGDKTGALNTATDPNQNIVAFRACGQERFTPGPVSPPVTATNGGGAGVPTIHASGVRRLTPLECLRLQGFPDDYFDGLNFSDSTKYKMLGNAVAVPVARWIAKHLRLLFK